MANVVGERYQITIDKAVREELGITPVPPIGLWADTNRLCNEDDPQYGEPLLEAAE